MRIANDATKTIPAATELQVAPVLQSTLPINIIFVNIDWKSSRHDSVKAEKRNLRKLSETITSIVSKQKPAVICSCEVGTFMKPMTQAQVQAMQKTICKAWMAAATEHCVPDIAFLYTERQPYLTTYDSQQCDCRYQRILSNLYPAAGEPRTAQAFLCCMPGDPDDAGIDTITVHAPSGTGKRQLQDWQRLELLTTLLQSKSTSRPFGVLRVGEAKFLIG